MGTGRRENSLYKVFFLEVPLFHGFWMLVYRAVILGYPGANGGYPGGGAFALASLLILFLLSGGFAVVSLAYGGALFFHYRGRMRDLFCCTLLTAAFGVLAVYLGYPGLTPSQIAFLVGQQTGGFLAGGLLGGLSRRVWEALRDK